jgi:hypothetical protein
MNATVGTMNAGRVRERRFVRAVAKGLTARFAAIAAGYHPNHSTALRRRLAGEIEHERRKLIGLARGRGIIPDRFGKADQQRLLLDEADL